MKNSKEKNPVNEVKSLIEKKENLLLLNAKGFNVILEVYSTDKQIRLEEHLNEDDYNEVWDFIYSKFEKAKAEKYAQLDEIIEILN